MAKATLNEDLPKMQDQTLILLVNSRLLRRESIEEKGQYYEISHDTLIQPIEKSKNNRKLKKQALKFIIAALTGVLLIMASSIAANYFKNQKNRAESKKLSAQALTTLIKDNNPTEAFRLCKEAFWYHRKNDHLFEVSNGVFLSGSFLYGLCLLCDSLL